jgi:sulfur transfer complex TusBCD TusB component (DsrH family)
MSDTDKEGMQYTKAKFRVFLQKKWRSKEMLGQYIRSIDRQLISEEDVFVLLSNGVTTAETESEILTANDQALQQKCHATKYYKRHQITNTKLLRDNITHYISMPNIGKRARVKTT